MKNLQIKLALVYSLLAFSSCMDMKGINFVSVPFT